LMALARSRFAIGPSHAPINERVRSAGWATSGATSSSSSLEAVVGADPALSVAVRTIAPTETDTSPREADRAPPMPDTLEAVAALVLALLPGALYVWAYERPVGAWGIGLSDRVLRFVGVSAILHALLAPLTYPPLWAEGLRRRA